MNKTNILITFVATHDAGDNKSDGPVINIFKKFKYDKTFLLYSDDKFFNIAKHVKKVIAKKDKCTEIIIKKLDIVNPTDHNEIYPKLLNFCKTLKPLKNKKFTAAIASGTPAMQVCWILMAESGDFPIDLIRSNEPKFGSEIVTPVKLGTGLPRIIKLQKEVINLTNEKNELIPELYLIVKKGQVVINNKEIKLSLMEFCYFRYFVERSLLDLEPEMINGFETPRHIVEKVLQYHKQSFPFSDTRSDLEKILKQGNLPLMNNFSSHKTNINKKIKLALKNLPYVKYFLISDFGKRYNKEYGLIIPSNKIKVLVDE